jgi:hypothetical protein
MNKQNETKLFAFKLAKKTQETKPAVQWKAREGVATAGCTGVDTRYTSKTGSKDWGVYC